MKTCVSGRTEIMWNTHRVSVTADNIVRYKASSLTILQHSLTKPSELELLLEALETSIMTNLEYPSPQNWNFSWRTETLNITNIEYSPPQNLNFSRRTYKHCQICVLRENSIVLHLQCPLQEPQCVTFTL